MKKFKVLSIGLAWCMFWGIVQPSVSISAADNITDDVSLGVYEGLQWDEGDIEGTRTGTYDDCDVNHNGSVNIIDAICVSQYLLGSIYFPNYRRFDTNRSSTVDYVDYQCVMAKIVNNTFSANYVSRVYNGDTPTENLVAFPNVTNNDITYYKDADANNTSSRGYTWQKYKQNTSNTASIVDNTDGGTYNITPSTTGLNAINGETPRAIIGNNDMHPANLSSYGEITGVVDVNGGTGFIVGDHEIATAAHMVLDDHSFIDVSVKVCNSNGVIQTSVLHVQQVHVPSAFLQITPSSNESDYINDYALIVVSEDLSTSNGYSHFNIGSTFNARENVWASVPIYVTGCPYNNYFQTAVGSLYGNSNTAIFHYKTDTTSGSSGAPVYTITKYQIGNEYYYSYTALAINTCHNNLNNPPQYNYGPLFTRYHRIFYLNNPLDPY